VLSLQLCKQPRPTNLHAQVEGEGDSEPDDPEEDFVEPPAPRVFEPPTSDMMLLHKGEWWATILADATVMLELSHQAITERLRGRNKWTTVGATEEGMAAAANGVHCTCTGTRNCCHAETHGRSCSLMV